MASYGRPRRHKSILNDDDDDDDEEQDAFPQQFTRGRRDRSVLSENDPINTGQDDDDDDSYKRNHNNNNNNNINNNIEEEDTPVWEREHTRSRRDRSVLYEDDDLSKVELKEEKQKEEEEEQEEEEEEEINLEQRLKMENRDIVFSGFLERKTNQKVLGKHLWETRYFKLSTHSLSVYINNKTNITESIIKLSTIISITRNNRLTDGSDLKNNRFDINLKNNRIINLRTENSTLCQQWIHFISQQRKKHRQSIRTGLDKIAENEENITTKKRTVRRSYKRQRTSRSDIKDKEHEKINIVDDNDNDNEWIDDDQYEDPEINDTIHKNTNTNTKITKPIEFEGFLIRKIGHNTEKIGEKLYFCLSNDSLEFSKIDEELNDNKQDLQRKHSTNILGSISIEHIKSVKINTNNNQQFTIVFNEHNTNSDWILSSQNGEQWVNILLKAQKNAKFIGKTINNINNGENNNKNNDNTDSESDTESDSDSNQFNTNRRKKKKKLGGHIKALQKMINEETIHELEVARNQELDKNLVNGFEINSLDNTHDVNTAAPNGGVCSCLCFK